MATISERFDEVIRNAEEERRDGDPIGLFTLRDLRQLKADVEAALSDTRSRCYHPDNGSAKEACFYIDCELFPGSWVDCEYGGRYQP